MCGGSGGKRGQRALRRSVSGLASIKLGLSASPPLATEERTPESAAPCRFRTCAPQQRASSLDRLVGDSEHARRIVRPVAGKVLSCPKTLPSLGAKQRDCWASSSETMFVRPHPQPHRLERHQPRLTA